MCCLLNVGTDAIAPQIRCTLIRADGTYRYAPMLGLLMLVIKYRADRANRDLDTAEKCACYGAVASSLVFIYAVVTQGKVDTSKMKPGRGGMSPLRPLGALGRYIAMALLVGCAVRR
jgi:hypothetical protein